MPETAQSLFLLRKRPRLPVSNKTKLLLILLVFIASYLSGKVTLLNDLSKKPQVLAETGTDLSVKDIPETDSGKSQQIQIKQIAIVQSEFIPPTSTPTPIPTNNPTNVAENEWGVATKIDSHTYTMRLQSDGVMATPQEILTALNTYRQQHDKGTLAWDDALAGLANTRAEYFSQKGTLDNHAGFLEYLNNQDGFKKLGFANVGENSSIGFTLQATHLIEWVYAGDAEHNDNQLHSDWHYVGVGVNGNATDLVFAGNKL